MTLSLDSSAIIDLLRGRDRLVRQRFQDARASGEELVVSTVALAELAMGVFKSERKDDKLFELESFLRPLSVAAFDDTDAFTAGRLQCVPELTAQPIGAPDLFISAQAQRRGWTVVTSNVRHFGRVPDLGIIDWRVSNAPLTSAQIAQRLV